MDKPELNTVMSWLEGLADDDWADLHSNSEVQNIAKAALELLEEQAGTGCWEWIEEDKYRCSECSNTTYVDECMEEPQYLFCPYCGHKMTWAGRNFRSIGNYWKDRS